MADDSRNAVPQIPWVHAVIMTRAQVSSYERALTVLSIARVEAYGQMMSAATHEGIKLTADSTDRVRPAVDSLGVPAELDALCRQYNLLRPARA